MSDNDCMALFFPEVFVKKIEIKEIMPCTVEANGIKFLAQADRTIEEILSILYLVIPNANFSEKIGALTYKTQERIVTIFSSGRIRMTHVKDRQLAETLVEELRNLINRSHVYLKTHGKPELSLVESKKALSAMRLYEKLSKTDCKECGEQSCFVFAAKLFLSEKTLQECPPLLLSERSEARRQLERMLTPIKL
jgi:ArsR family metal-binding transcriptional regulator